MEIWKQSSEKHYEVSSLGRVRNNRNYRTRKVFVSTNGYYIFNVGGTNTKTVHRLIANAFIPNLNNLEQVNHKDGNKLNNNLDNLEWMSRSDNCKHSFRLGTSYQTKCIKVGVYANGVLLCIFNSIYEASRVLNVDRRNIYNVLRGTNRAKTAKGYSFKLVD